MKKDLVNARTCYGHLAGKAGVRLTKALVDMDLITKEESQFLLTEKGKNFFTDFGLDIPALCKKNRSFSRCCLDGSERKYHLAGALGDAFTEELFKKEWIERVPGNRGVTITELGKNGFKETFYFDEW